MPSLLPRLKPAPVRAISEVEEESLDLDMSTGSSEQSLDPDGQAETDQTDYQMVLRMLEDGEKVGDTELTCIHLVQIMSWHLLGTKILCTKVLNAEIER